MAFIKFESQNTRLESRITVTKTYSFGLPSHFFRDNHIDQFRFVVLYFDPDQKAVGFHFTNDELEKHKFSILKSKQGYGGSIVAASFFKSYGLDPKQYYGRYEWEKNVLPEIGEIFVITLRERAEIKQVEPAQPPMSEPINPPTAEQNADGNPVIEQPV